MKYYTEKMRKNWTMWDVKSVSWCGIVIGLILAKAWPNAVSLDWHWYIIAFAIFYLVPVIRLFRK
jgi:hypothetical protein